MTRDSRPENAGVSRRVLVAGVALLAGFTALLPSALRAKSPAEQAILAALSDHRSARHVGRLSLAAWPHMHDRAALVQQILGELEIGIADAPHIGTDELRRRLAGRIQADFATARTVRLDGWLMALTEARLCALAALNA
jgi:hypothetical protein